MYTTWYNAKLITNMKLLNIIAITTISIICCSNKRNTMLKICIWQNNRVEYSRHTKMHIITTITEKVTMYLATWAAQDVWKPVTTTRTMLDNIECTAAAPVDSWCHYLGLMWNDYTIVMVAWVHNLTYTWYIDLCVIKCVMSYSVLCTVVQCLRVTIVVWEM